jgi:UDP:flavonoid glycosyltransferase YjiC (YdhE family)
MTKTVVFLFPNLTGHLNPTLQIAKEYFSKGYKVIYASTMDVMPFAKKHSYDFYAMNSLAFGTGMEDAIHDSKKEKWLESLIDRHSDKSYKQRKLDIEKLILEVNPEWIFLDEFNYSDFILLYPHKRERRIVLLQTKFPMYYSEVVPPLNTYAFPGKKAKGLWRKYFFKRNFKEAWSKIKYLGKSDLSILKEKFKENGLPEKYAINTQKVFRPTFKNLEEWFLVKKELDFKEQKLEPWQKYVEPQIDLNRKEDISESCKSFITWAKANSGNKLIYCSLGTVLKTHTKGKEKVALAFFQNLIDIAAEKENYWFYIAVDASYLKSLKPRSANIKLVPFAPQMYLLKHANLFLTHAGPGSVFEGVIAKTPMLLFPLNKKWDQNGTAARVVYHGLGIKSNLHIKRSELLFQLNLILEKNQNKDALLHLGCTSEA